MEALSAFGFRKDYNPEDRVINQETVKFKGNEYLVSTVDLGLDHSFCDGAPLYWETMVFLSGSYSELYCDRYSTKVKAIEGHNRIVKAFRNNSIKVIDGFFEL